MKQGLLIMQSAEGTITTQQGQVPVIEIQSHDGSQESVMALNFLRSGCPKVQLLIEDGVSAPEKRQKMADLLLALQLPGEKLFLHGKPENQITKKKFTILILGDRAIKTDFDKP